MDLGGGGDVKVEHEQSHGDGKDAVAEGGEAVDIAALDAVVESGHGRADSSWSELSLVRDYALMLAAGAACG